MIFERTMNDGRHIFVFGSNESGLHSGGAANEAFHWWGAVWQHGIGPAGSAYAIPTMDWEMKALPLETIRHYVERFKAYARLHPRLKFLVTAIGTGICGYNHAEIAPMFSDAPANCVLPEEWTK